MGRSRPYLADLSLKLGKVQFNPYYAGGANVANHYKVTLSCGERSMAFYYSRPSALGDPDVNDIVDSLIADIKRTIKGAKADSTWEEKFQVRVSEKRAEDFIAVMGDKFLEVEKELT